MVAFAVVVDAKTLERSRLGGITGVIYIQLGGQAFPEVGWNDFPVVVLDWWLRELQGVRAAGKTAECPFMDGAFFFEMMVGSEVASIVRLKPDVGMAPIAEGTVETKAAMLAIKRAAQAIVDACEERGWASADIDTLKRAVRL